MAWPSLYDMRVRARDLLKEQTPARFSTAQLNRWANEGERDIAIKSLCIESVLPTTTTPSQRFVSSGAAIKVLHVELLIAGAQPIDLLKITPLHIGHVEVGQSEYPQYWFPWGNLVGLEPIPTATFNLNLYLSVMPTIEMSSDTDTPQVIRQAYNLIPEYMQGIGLLKSREYARSASVFTQYFSILQSIRSMYIDKYADFLISTQFPDLIVTSESTETEE